MEFPRWCKSAGLVGLVLLGVVGFSPGMAEASFSQSLPPASLTQTSSAAADVRALGFKPTPAIDAAQFAGAPRPHSALSANAIPASVDLTPFAPTPGDQGQVNSCVSWSVGYDLMGYYSNKTGHVGAPYAPMYLYSQVNGGVDDGSTFADTFRVLASQGVDTKADYRPQGDFGWQQKPTAAQKASAALHRSLAPTLLFAGAGQGTIARTALSNALAAGQPVVIGISVYNNFFYLGNSKSTFSQADVSGQLLGYHAVTAFGYNATGLVIENSWGTGWGKSGFATLGWDFVQNGVIEAWTAAGFAPTLAPVSVAVSPTAWASAGTGTAATITAASAAFGSSASAFTSLGWRLTVGGVVVPLTWRSSSQLAFVAPAGAVGPASVVLSQVGVPATVTTQVSYVPSISGLSITQRADGTRLLTISGAGFVSGAQWNLLAPSGATSPLNAWPINNIATGAVNRIWIAPGGRSAIALLGAVDPVLREVGSYGISYVAPSGGAILAWPNGGVPFVAPTVASLSLTRVTGSVGSDVTVSGDGMAAFLAPFSAGVRLVSAATGQAIELTVKAKTIHSVTVSIPAGTTVGAYHLVVWTPLGVSNAAAPAAAMSVVATGIR